MSRIPYTINVDEYICTALEQMRKMNESRDYSGLAAAIERIQHHANHMESALYSYEHIKNFAIRELAKEDVTADKFMQAMKEKLAGIEKNQC